MKKIKCSKDTNCPNVDIPADYSINEQQRFNRGERHCRGEAVPDHTQAFQPGRPVCP